MTREVSYEAISSDVAFQLIKEKEYRTDLFFEEKRMIASPGVLKNLSKYELDVSKINDVNWFLRTSIVKDSKDKSDAEDIGTQVEEVTE